ncbi:hypothetical protein Tco_0771391 [Tanacetum coccineum]|uniref:Uncharacterized protein n=1 Tax=Tanacetum coccineum TaxID=301880 RepID=A0ABQ4ZF68_9ASTR
MIIRKHATITLNTFKFRISIKLGMLHMSSSFRILSFFVLSEGYNLLALVDGFTPVEDNIGLLEARFDVEAFFVIVFLEDVTGLVNLTLLTLFIGVTATNCSPELMILGHVLLIFESNS